MKTTMLAFLLLVLVLIATTGCLPGGGAFDEQNQAGFLWGVWHGWIAPISLLVGLFNHQVTIYEAHNTGWWYDLAFYLAIIGGFGGLSLSRHRS